MNRKEEIEQQQELEEIRRMPIPKQGQVLCICDQRVGGSRMKMKCTDGKSRIGRIPGRLKRKLWVREGDILLVEPWELGGDEKGDILYKYKSIQIDQLKKRGFLKQLEQIDEF